MARKFSAAARLGCGIFGILIALALLLSIPVYSGLRSGVDSYTQKLCQLAYEKTGLKISYTSLSPSILSTFYVKGIELSDGQDEKILSVRRTKLNYSLRLLLRRDFEGGIRDITVDGVSVNLDALLDVVSGLRLGGGSGSLELADIIEKIPGRVFVKNLVVSYGNEAVSADLSVKKIAVTNMRGRENAEFTMDSSFSALLKGMGKKVSCQLALNGVLQKELDGSSVQVRLSNLTDGEWVLGKLNLLLSYNQRNVTLSTIQAVYPLAVSGGFNLDTMRLEAKIGAKRLYPLSVVSNPGRQKEFRRFKNINLDFNGSFDCDLSELTFGFAADADVRLPPELVRDGLEITLALSGDETRAELSRLAVNGTVCEAETSLSLVYKTLQVSGLAEIYRLILPNGNVVSSEIYFDPLKKGFMAFAPQILVGDKYFTAAQFNLHPEEDSFDFDFEVLDYAHLDAEEAGQIRIDGSYLNASRYVQASASLSSLYLDSLAETVALVLPAERAEAINSAKNALSSYLLAGDAYFSTDFKSLSYNFPYIMLANPEQDNQFVRISLNGNDQSVSLNQISVILGSFALDASASLDRMEDTGEMFFTADVVSSSVPYHFTGTVLPGEVITVSGDYQTELELRTGHDGSYSGHINFDNLPVLLRNTSLVFACDSSFLYTRQDGPEFHLERVSVEETGSLFGTNPRFSLSGNATKYGAQFDSVAYSDVYSSLEGAADFVVNINESVFDSASLVFDLRSTVSDERVSADVTVSNPEGKKIDIHTVQDSVYVDAQLLLNKFSLNRFASLKNDDNTISASLFATGTFEHPYVSAVLDNLNLLVGGKFLTARGSASLQERDLAITDVDVNYSVFHIHDVFAEGSLSDMSGSLAATVDAEFAQKKLNVPFTLALKDSLVERGRMLPSSFTVALETTGMNGSFLHKPFDFSLTGYYSDGGISLMTSQNIGLYGMFGREGDVYARLDGGDTASFEASGSVVNRIMNIRFSDINIDLEKIFSYINLDKYLFVDSGVMNGSFSLMGEVNDPDFKGALAVTKPRARLPTLLPEPVYTEKTLITLINNEINIIENSYYMKKSEKARIWCNIYLNRWFLDHLECSIESLPNVMLPARVVTPVLTIEGDVNGRLFLYLENNVCELTGRLFGEKVNLKSDIMAVSNPENSHESKVFMHADLQVSLGTHAIVDFNPLLRCVLVPDSSFAFKADTESSQYSIDGQLALRSGDISYLNRNFYIKEGEIKFNTGDLTNPLVTIRAETRERDSQGQNVRIVLSATNQYLQDFNPRFSSIPAKSETEIQSLLGQIVIADSDKASDFLFAAGDYLIQSAITRNIENKLRDLMNFDIFSVRTNVLQNTLSMGTSRNLSRENISIGNFLDNSTVYIGKYLGSALYVDAMLHLSFEQGQVTDIAAAGRLLPQPDVGLEMESPFGNIRWDMSADINALMNNQFVPSTAITLSWKISF